MEDGLIHVELRACPPDRFRAVLRADAYARFEDAMNRAPGVLDGRVIWHVNSTAQGGGVAEILQSLIPYLRGAGIDCRWVVIRGNPDFFRVTKRLHNNLHGEFGDGGDLAEPEQRVYETILQQNADELLSFVAPGDVLLLHDPQTAGLIPHLRRRGVCVIWRCHVGLDTPNDLAHRAWNFLRPYVIQADACVFSRRAFAWEALDEEKIWVVAPSIEPFSPKNQNLDERTVGAILHAAGLSSTSSSGTPAFTREDGTGDTVRRRAHLVDGGSPPSSSVKLVVQISRWDRLKDPLGVIEGFVRYVSAHSDAHLLMAGPAVEGVADDPEAAEVLRHALELWQQVPEEIRSRVHLATLPMEDTDENAAIVNALQRRADVIVQKSLAEGFGLTVSEAMWKGRPVVASRIGGIQDQITDGVNGLLVTNPSDLTAFGEAVVRLLTDEPLADRLGNEARERVRDEFLHPRHLIQHVELVEHLLPDRVRPAEGPV